MFPTFGRYPMDYIIRDIRTKINHFKCYYDSNPKVIIIPLTYKQMFVDELSKHGITIHRYPDSGNVENTRLFGIDIVWTEKDRVEVY